DGRGVLAEARPVQPGRGAAQYRPGGPGDGRGLDRGGRGGQQQGDPRREAEPPDHGDGATLGYGAVPSPGDGSSAAPPVPSASVAAFASPPDLAWLSSSSSRAPWIRRNERWARPRARTATSSWVALIPPSPLPWLDRAVIAAPSAAPTDMPVA